MNSESSGLRKPEAIEISGDSLTIEDVIAVSRQYAVVKEISSECVKTLQTSRQWVDHIVTADTIANDGRPLPVYGINTPFGSLAYRSVLSGEKEAEKLSRNLIMSHAGGVGNYLSEDVVRAALLIRANSLAKGFSGIRPEIVNTLIQLLNAKIYPAIPEKGSVGASGDLAPLSHLALIISEPVEDPDTVECSGEVLVSYEPQKHNLESCVTVGGPGHQTQVKVKTFAKQELENAGIQRWRLGAKEGLALNNGATFSAAMAALVLYDAELLVKNAEIALAMTVEAVLGHRDAFFPHVHMARGHPGARCCASNVLKLVEGSSLLDGNLLSDPTRCPPQDGYSIRCAPQVIGAIRDTLQFARSIIETELNAACDNPLIFASEDGADPYYLPRSYKAVSCGNFHGEPLAFAMDFLGIAVAELGSIAERRIFRLLTGSLNRGLESMLVSSPPNETGLHSGLMIAQYTAAALASDNKTLAHPDSVDSIPTCEDQEDHVSMSPNACRHAGEIVWNVQQIIGIELLCAAQALDFRLRRVGTADTAIELGKGTHAAFECIRQSVKHWDRDRPLYPDLQEISALSSSGAIVNAVDKYLQSALD